MGNINTCLTRDKTGYTKYENRYVYCTTCPTKTKYNAIYIMAHCANKSFAFCSETCYGRWIVDETI